MPGARFGEARRVVYYRVIFQDGHERRWWWLFTRRGWRHCWVIYPIFYPAPGLLADEYTAKIEHGLDGLDHDIWWMDPETVAQGFLEIGVTAVVVIRVDSRTKCRYLRAEALTCVSAVKAALGLNAWWVQTPHGLFRYLMRRGGRLMEKPNGE